MSEIASAASFRPCLVIPAYNHGSCLDRLLDELIMLGLDCYVVNDGSTDETSAVLERRQAGCRRLTVVDRLCNGGKGAAVISGLKAALSAGYTHAVQIDADGQHCAGDVLRFLDAARGNPGDLIVGHPIFDASIPWQRLWGRKLSIWLSWLETLSFGVSDILCGYRCYPLEPMRLLLDRHKFSERMGFDIEVVVLLQWRGLRAVNVPTKVIYPPGGVSHFRLWRDNVVLITLHLRLLAGMIIRAPRLLAHKFISADRRAWFEKKERGSQTAFRIGFFLYRILGRRIGGWVLLPVAAYFWASATAARTISRRYLTALRSASPEADAILPKNTAWAGICHFWEFCKMVLDQVAVWAGDIPFEQLHWTGFEKLAELVNRKKGAILISAHLGNIDMVRALSDNIPGVKVRALMFREHAQIMRRSLEMVNPKAGDGILPLEDISVDSVAAMREILNNGELLALKADRIAAGSPDRRVAVTFLGAKAYFPEGPWILAHLLEAPVYLVISLRQKDGSYAVTLESFADRIDLPRSHRAAALESYMQQYADRLADYCRKAPLQWYNFFDFWAEPR